jgi:exosome complex RNA-binding protein Rrp42 (RNase PH superfamily)
MAESHGVSQVQLSRLLDRSIRESDSIDTESLCIVSGEKVWLISCDVRVIDYSGGNVVDAALFAAMSAFKAFRKPEVSIVSVAGKSTLRYYNRFVIILHSSVLGTALTLV